MRHEKEHGLAKYLCPVCGYDGLTGPAYDSSGVGTYDICACCGYEFGVTDDDERITHAQWRRQWIESGMNWSSSNEAPAGWDPARQLSEHDLSTATLSALWLNAAQLQGKPIQVDTPPVDERSFLPLGGRCVARTRTRYSTTVRFTDQYSLTIEAPFAVTHTGLREEFDPDSGKDDPSAVEALIGLEVATAEVDNTGALQLRFTDGTLLEIRPDGQSEPWNLRVPRKLLVVSLPSGELATWSSR